MKQTRGSATTSSVGGLLEISGSVTTSSYQFNGQIVAMRDSSAGVRSLHGDHLGSVSLATNASGTVVSRQEFDPWGQLRSGGISQTDINDTGQRLDDTGLLSYHAQMDDPALARFVSADSIVPGMAGSNGGAAARLGYDPQVALRPLTAYGASAAFTYLAGNLDELANYIEDYNGDPVGGSSGGVAIGIDGESIYFLN